MEQKTNLIYVLTALWIIIGVLFLGSLITYGSYFFDSNFSPMFFSSAAYFILLLFITMIAFVLTYGTFTKKSWSWLIGIMFSSFLGFHAYQGVMIIGNTIMMGNIDGIFRTPYSGFQYVTFFLTIFFVPILLFILTRPTVKAYFGKT
jgi:hypothetical protein